MAKPWENFMRDNMTWEALNKSEVFSAYMREESRRMADDAKQARAAAAETERQAVLKLGELQRQVNENESLRAALLKAKRALASDESLRGQVDPDFVRGLEMLDLGDIK